MLLTMLLQCSSSEYSPKFVGSSILCLQIWKSVFLSEMQQAEKGTTQTVTCELTHLVVSHTYAW